VGGGRCETHPATEKHQLEELEAGQGWGNSISNEPSSAEKAAKSPTSYSQGSTAVHRFPQDSHLREEVVEGGKSNKSLPGGGQTTKTKRGTTLKGGPEKTG